MQELQARILIVGIVALGGAMDLPRAYSQDAIPRPAASPASPTATSTGAIPPRQQSTTGTQMQDLTGAVGVSMDARSFIIDGSAYVARESLDAGGLQTLGKASKVFGLTGIGISAAAGLYRAGEQYAAGDCEGAGKTAARTGVAAASDLAVMSACAAMGPPGIVVGAGYAVARQTDWGNKAINAAGDELYYSAKGIFGDGPKEAPFDLDQRLPSAPSGFRLNENPFAGSAPNGYDAAAAMRSSFQAAQSRNAIAMQRLAQQEADARAQAQASADAAVAAQAQAQAMSDLQAQTANLTKSIGAARTPPVSTPKSKSADPAAGAAACANPKTFPTKDGCHPGHDESAHPGGCHC